jgi:hypothetical protein
LPIQHVNRALRSLRARPAPDFIRVFPASSLQANVLKQAALFCGAALSVWLLSMSNGLDLSAGFF